MLNTINYTEQGLRENNLTLLEKYWRFCDRQSAALWFILPIFILPCVIFTLGFFIQYLNDKPEVWYFTICGITLYSNILPNIAEANTRVTVTNFILTILFHLFLWLFLIF